MNNNVYNISIKSIVRWWTPVPWRGSSWLLFLEVATNELMKVYVSFLQYRQAKVYELLITPQVGMLERLLNDRYDFTNRGIYIEDGKDFRPLFIYRRDELKPVGLYKRIEDKVKPLYTRGESGIIKNDFIVFVPMAVVFDMNEMAVLIRKFKLAGTKFKIQRI